LAPPRSAGELEGGSASNGESKTAVSDAGPAGLLPDAANKPLIVRAGRQSSMPSRHTKSSGRNFPVRAMPAM
jgi:hypothetical protein